MNSYTIHIHFTNAQIETLYATGTNVILSKPPTGGLPNVAWQVFKPGPNNIVSWLEEYGLYASSTKITNGSNIPQFSKTSVPVYKNKLYTFEPSGVISGPSSGGFPDGFTLINKYNVKDYMVFGTYQNAIINNTPITGNATASNYVLLNHSMYFIPCTNVYIWLQSKVKSNSIVENSTSPITKLEFPAGVSTLSIAYDSSTGTFIPSNSISKTTTVLYPLL